MTYMKKPRYARTKPNLHNNFPQIQLYKGQSLENSNTSRESTPKKKQESNPLSTNSKEDSHTNIIPYLTTKITERNNHYSLISLNISGLNYPIKRHKLTDRICRQDQAFCCIQEMHIKDKTRYYLRVNGWKKKFQAKGPKEQAGVAILI